MIMTEVERILDQYDRAIQGDAWHGDPVWTILAGITPEQAATAASANAHTIWELVSHMTFWETEVYRRLKHLSPRSPEGLNFPALPDVTAENWNRTLQELRQSNQDFRAAVSQLEDSQLDNPLPGRDKPTYVELHGVIQHNLYHAGQIALLRRILAAN
jgi:uncharacterized damage-inducible protein DinB